LAELILERGMRAAERAAGVVMADPRGQEAVARAVGLAQRGLKLFEEVQERALHAAGLAARPDYDDLRRQVVRLKRKARELSERLEGPPAASGSRPGGKGGGSSGKGGPGGRGDGSP